MILAWVGLLVVSPLDEAVEARGEGGAHDGAEPVYPVVSGEAPPGDGTPEAAGWVERAARVVDAYIYIYQLAGDLVISVQVLSPK